MGQDIRSFLFPDDFQADDSITAQMPGKCVRGRRTLCVQNKPTPPCPPPCRLGENQALELAGVFLPWWVLPGGRRMQEIWECLTSLSSQGSALCSFLLSLLDASTPPVHPLATQTLESLVPSCPPALCLCLCHELWEQPFFHDFLLNSCPSRPSSVPPIPRYLLQSSNYSFIPSVTPSNIT